MSRAIVLFAHGARDPRWAEPFEAVAARVRAAAPGCPVVLAFLELMAPPLGDAVERLVAAGATRVDVVPLFLGTGGHLRQDLPPLVDALRAAHPGGRDPPARGDRRARRGDRGDGARRRRLAAGFGE